MSYISHCHTVITDPKDIIEDLLCTLGKREAFDLCKQYLTVVTPNFQYGDSVITYCTETNNGLEVPRYGLDVKFTDKRGSGDTIDTEWKGTLHTIQQIIIKHLMETVYNNVDTGACCLALEAGKGKSYIATWLIAKFKVKTLIVIHSTSILEQWHRVLQECLSGVTVGEYHAKKHTDGDIVLMVVNSAILPHKTHKGKHISNETYFAQFGFTIFDEAHKYVGEKNHHVFRYANSKRQFGLTATPDQATVLKRELNTIIDPRMLEGFKGDDTKFDVCVHQIKYNAPKKFIYEKKSWQKYANHAQVINLICRDAMRTSRIAECINHAIDKEHNILVLSDRREHLDQIHTHFPFAEILDDEKQVSAQKITGGASKSEMETAENESQLILSTYGYFGTGKSIPRLTAIVLATPRTSKLEQFIKRICRLGYSDRQRDVYDIHDTLNCHSSWSARKRYYKEQNWIIKIGL